MKKILLLLLAISSSCFAVEIKLSKTDEAKADRREKAFEDWIPLAEIQKTKNGTEGSSHGTIKIRLSESECTLRYTIGDLYDFSSLPLSDEFKEKIAANENFQIDENPCKLLVEKEGNGLFKVHIRLTDLNAYFVGIIEEIDEIEALKKQFQRLNIIKEKRDANQAFEAKPVALRSTGIAST